MAEIRAKEETSCLIAHISSDQEKKQARAAYNARMRAWETLFQYGGLGLNEDLFQVINPKTIKKSDPRLASIVLQLYSMETFIY